MRNGIKVPLKLSNEEYGTGGIEYNYDSIIKIYYYKFKKYFVKLKF